MSESKIGSVKWFNNRKGFGFLTNMDTKDEVFVHFSGVDVPEGVFKALYEGEYVSYIESTDDNGKKVAVNVTGVKGGPLLCQNETKRVYLVTKDENGNAPLRLGRGGGQRGGQRDNQRGGHRGGHRGSQRGGQGSGRRYERSDQESQEESSPVDESE